MLAPALRGIGNPANTLGELLRRWRLGAFVLVVSPPIIEELRRTMVTRYFSQSVSAEDREALLELLATEGRLVEITVAVSGVATQPEDDLILATAVSARAAYLVTGDSQVLKLAKYLGVQIVTPRDFLTILNDAEGQSIRR